MTIPVTPPSYPLPPKQCVDVLGSSMAYVDTGDGDPIVLLHGNPTSSYLWRSVLPHLDGLGRLIAPDLVGMGDSAKLAANGPDTYSFETHRRHLDGLLDAVGVRGDITLVLHDWGSALGFDWARRHPDAVKAIAYMEAIVRPMTWNDWPDEVRPVFEALRSDAGEQLVLDDNVFVEQVLPHAVMRPLTETEMDEYRRPFSSPGESRRPTLAFPRELPIDGEPAHICQIVADYGAWLAESAVPKLLVVAEPGVLLRGENLAHCRRWPNQTEVTVPGLHFLQEDSGDQIGQAVAAWLRAIGTGAP